MTQVAPEPPLHRALGLTDGELDRIQGLLGRNPNDFELAVFSLLWSEHCGYKHSALLLKRLPSLGKRVLQGPGENAGVIDLGEGEAVAFKVESHNHPSAVEPFQGAATGVGGILRDIVAMGARPIAILDGLRFADDGWPFRRAVAGIGYYGNCLAADESIVYRNSGTVRATTIGKLAEERGADGESWTAKPNRPFQVLSFDPESGTAEWRDVTRVFKRKARRLVRIQTALGRRVTVTPDHPVIVVTEGRLVERSASSVKEDDQIPLIAGLPESDVPSAFDLIDLIREPAAVVLPPHWEPSKTLRSSLRAVLTRADARHYWLSRKELPVEAFRSVEHDVDVGRDHLRVRLAGPRSTPLPAVLPLDKQLARLIGYYLAEGCCSANGTTSKIIWTFGRNRRDTECVGDVIRILDGLRIRHSIEVRASTVAITVSSRLLARLLTEVLECGSRSHEKRIPSVLMEAGRDLQREVLKGIFRGDGSFSFPRRGSRVKVSHLTTSRALHEQLLLLIQRLGVIPSCYVRPARTGQIRGRLVRSREAYALEIYGHQGIVEAAPWFDIRDAHAMLIESEPSRNSPFAAPKARRENGYVSVAVTSVTQIESDEPVYDIEVPGSHLFVTSGGIITHNCVGLATVGGEAVFDEAYRGNCLVNAMCVGLLPADRVTRARASVPGARVVVYGATTGRDGIGGASVLASQELGEDDPDKRPSVQIGDPFTGKKLIEASLELVEGGLVESLQDCGAAGLASALAEMARDGAGIEVQLDRVPLRETEMEPWEIMISESQERMVAVVRPQMLDAVRRVCAKWELPCAAIGEVTDDGVLRAYHDGDVVGEISASFLTDECPRYDVDRAPHPITSVEPAPANFESKRWIYEQYDHLVGSRTIRRPGLDAAVLRLRPSLRGIAVSLQGPPPGEDDPFVAGILAVLGAARNVACAGGEPLALTDCLN
ncbi:MAG: AIR synthase-related protein, partial [Gaiellaceae bacterium]